LNGVNQAPGVFGADAVGDERLANVAECLLDLATGVERGNDLTSAEAPVLAVV
jgi:hypothetical protein